MAHIIVKDGKTYPSVTTILQCLGDKEFLKLANQLGFAHKSYEDMLNTKAKFGTKIHERLRSIIDPENSPVIEKEKDQLVEMEINKYLERFTVFLSHYHWKTISSEKYMFSEKLGFYGTCDWLAEFGEKTLLLDFKTSTKVMHHHLLQLGGYSILLNEEGIQLDGAGIILVNKRVCALYPITRSTLDFYADAFSKIAAYYLTMQDHEMNADVDFGDSLLDTDH